ncbi:YbaB/EbfC family nucleoid-associated protein [Nocardia gipuzkoensis]
MTDLQQWEQQLQHDLTEIRRNSQQAAQALQAVRGRSETRGITIEVNATGDITTLQIAPGAMKWSNTQLTNALLDCHRQAQADAATKAKQAAQTIDPRISASLQQLQNMAATEPRQQRQLPMTEEEIQAADDAYFERMNRPAWGT